jgi:hypothetical protein
MLKYLGFLVLNKAMIQLSAQRQMFDIFTARFLNIPGSLQRTVLGNFSLTHFGGQELP